MGTCIARGLRSRPVHDAAHDDFMALPHHTSTRKAESTRGSILVRTAPEAPGLHRGRPAWLPPATADEGITTRKVKSCHKALPSTVPPPSGDPCPGIGGRTQPV